MVGSGSISSNCFLWKLVTLLFALWFQDKHEIPVKLTTVNHSDNKSAEYFFFKPHDYIYCFITKNVFLIIESSESTSYFQMPLKDTLYTNGTTLSRFR